MKPFSSPTARRSSSPIVFLLAAACGGAAPPVDGGVDPTFDAASVADVGSAMPVTHFVAEPFSWPVPPRVGLGFDAIGGDGWTSVDLDGDGAIDLVETRDPSTGAVFGWGASPHWQVFRNLGHGFSTAPALWAVPAANGLPRGLDVASGTGWALIDLDGDHRPDLVWTEDPASGAVWGQATSPHWQVFRNTGTGFAPAAFAWSVPAGPSSGFRSASAGTWATIDLDGDTRPDLVWTSPVERGAVFGFGTSPHWRVFRNEGDRFASEPASWPVPAASELSQGLASLAGDGWVVVDFDGDARPDLVWTRDPHTGTVWGADGSPHWRVHLNEGDGFGRQALVPVPAPPSLLGGFDSVAGEGWAMLDLDADRRPDLVWARDPSSGDVHGAATGPHWLVYPNRGDRLEATPGIFSVPDPPELAGGFDSVSEASWSVLDLDGQGTLDLVWTRATARSGVFGASTSPHWRLYPGSD